MNREMVTATLEEVGLGVDIAQNGAEAVAMADRLRPPLILMDLHMPIMDGFTATRGIRGNPETANIPIIGLSADAFVEREQEAQGAGMTHFLTKPVNLNDLMPLLTRYLGRADDNEAPHCPEKKTEPAPEALRDRLRKGFQTLAGLPLFESARIVALCDELENECAGYDTPYLPILIQIREAVFSRNSKTIPDLLGQAEQLE